MHRPLNVKITECICRLIEEFMLLANMTVAKRLSTDFPELAFLRRHPSPHQFTMEELKKSLEQRGIFLDIQSAGALQASMARYAGDDFVSQARMMVLNNLCAKPMSVSRHFDNDTICFMWCFKQGLEQNF